MPPPEAAIHNSRWLRQLRTYCSLSEYENICDISRDNSKKMLDIITYTQSNINSAHVPYTRVLHLTISQTSCIASQLHERYSSHDFGLLLGT
jgi:hypothetical protein